MTFYSVYRYFQGINSTKILLSAIWATAWIGLKITKSLEFIFYAILLLPDKFFKCVGNPKIKNNNDKDIEILKATDIRGKNITNKFKLFLHYYWENNKDKFDAIHDTNGFDFNKFYDLLGSAFLCCSYMLKDSMTYEPKKFHINIENNRKDIYKAKIPVDNDDTPISSKNYSKLYSDDRIERLPYGHVNFDEKNEEINMENFAEVIRSRIKRRKYY